jgi:uncharacterized damage-inducible protein DinB
MIDREHCRLMAEYNGWMNGKLYALCATLSDAERRQDRGAFFRSIHGTLNHIMFGDLAFLSRLTGNPPQVPEMNTEFATSFDELRRKRSALDERIAAWTQTLTPEWLASSLTYTSKVDGRSRTIPHWILLTQMFNHETHHRGQITTLLTQMGHDIGSTDIPFMPRFRAA